MKSYISTLLILIGMISGSLFAATQGYEKGEPFQETQQAIDAAVAAEAAARASADEAESAARASEDAILAAAIAAEKVARIEADMKLEADIAASAALLLGLEGRVSILEELALSRSVTWIETAGYDAMNIAGAIETLGYTTGEWLAVISRNVGTGIEMGNCSNHPQMGEWLQAAVLGTQYQASIGGEGSYFLTGGEWVDSPTINFYSNTRAAYPYFQIYGVNWKHFLIDRKHRINYGYGFETQEIYSYVSGAPGSGYGLGNTLTLNAGQTRFEACGF